MIMDILASCIIYSHTYEKEAGASAQLKVVQQVTQCQPTQAESEDDKRVRAIKRFLAKYDYGLQASAEDFVKIAREYKADPYLLVAIAGKESTFGKHQCAPYNAWGYGNPCHGFNSFADGIRKVAKTIMGGRAYKKFQQTGEVTHLAPVYNKPQGYEDWVKDVTWFIEKIKKEEYE